MPSDPPLTPHSARSHKTQYVIFNQDQTRLAISLTSVREVLRLSDQRLTPIPNSPGFVLGLTNLRGDILTIVDFGKFFGLQPLNPHHADSRILIVEAPSPQDPTRSVIPLGLAVSHVDTVVTLDPQQMRSAAEASASLVPFLQGLYNHQDQLFSVIDIGAIATCSRW
ncbi:purine-binding chemotaxis protein CheW [Geitlerinema sp. P-1104]|uniref:chemotaxis protein CheW n=1 Tax=Geitlerinema sp. P-1104 TaxID=2546230 RepID=UPI0014773D31|nr:chemotaxis protein CheW [Geitlerinema sp. P-1104]NMG58191.1 purine-binding chemotaxis protein CheW [Geitlerinema sp. P-1104]